ncbi:ABC transporter ATP-binding protein [Halomontanus rarus]|uniref:ABC transporter ATP-binding protein n=1 Tax=Halomontanus rarus TaxID=3034020 RepID=UPI0023E7E7C8|nr:ABC transporter ATP-binding protein [Halovivax sp. TS33]
MRDDDEAFAGQRERIDAPMRRLFGTYGRRNWRPLAVGVVASAASHVLGLLPILILGVTLDAVFLETRPYAFPGVPEAWVPEDRIAQFWLSVGLVFATFALSAVAAWIQGLGLNAFAQRIQHEVRTDTYDAMQDLDMAFFAEKETGEMTSILSNDVNRLEQFLNGGFNVACMLTFTVGGVALLMAVENWQLALVTLIAVPIIAVFTHWFVQKVQPIYEDVRSTVGTLNSRIDGNLGGIEVIKASNTEDLESERVAETSDEYYRRNWDAIRLSVAFFPGLRVIGGAGFLLTFVVGGYWVFLGAPGPFSGELTAGTFVVFVLYSQRMVFPMAQFGQLINLYQQARASAERIFGLMEQPNRLETDPDAPPLSVGEARVEYDDVTFGYEEDERVLEDLSFTLEGGETLAFVGPTGAGKSTALKLLLRFHDVDRGAIRIDGQDVREVELGSLRRSIGYVSQETFLFSGSVRDNIAYGQGDVSDETVREAAKAAQAHEFVTELSEGYDTKVGERGVKLSGGQRQRVGIARVLLQDPDVLILDEATSDVDTETERAIQAGLDVLTEDRTTLAIAHRLSTIKDADQILFLEDGRVKERGTHEELLASEGRYADLWGVQAGELAAIE